MKTLLLIPFLFLSFITYADSDISTFTSDIVKKSSVHNVKNTMDKLEKIVTKQGLTIFARVNHRAGAKKVGLDMNDAEVLIFGNPKMGTAIMKFDTAAGLDLPLRVLVYADKDGKTWLSYHNPQGLRNYYDVAKSPALVMAEGALGKLTSKAVE